MVGSFFLNCIIKILTTTTALVIVCELLLIKGISMQSTFHNKTSKGTGSNLCTIEPQLWQSSGRDATVYPGRCRPPPRSAPFAPLRPNTAAPILRTSARVHVPVSPNPPLPSSPPFKAPNSVKFGF